MITETTFGTWLKKHRRQLDLTQNDLALQSGCSVGTVRKIEQDARRPSKQLAVLLAESLNIPPERQQHFVTFARTKPYTAENRAALIALEAQEPEVVLGETAVFPPPNQPKHNLRAQLIPFLGRQQEIGTLLTLLADPHKRLLTIVGPGGMGKTRLAIAVAEQLLSANQYADGIFVIDLAPIREAGQILPTLAKALEYKLLHGDDTTIQQRILDYLEHKQMLLIFDNFEHVLDGVDLLTEIAQTAPQLQILVTSRERLRVRYEQVYRLGGLAYPEQGDVKNVAEFTAVQFFLQTAQRNQPDFTLLAQDEWKCLARICQLVEGMPLALELAAPWVDMLSLQEMTAELQQGLNFLETDMRDMPTRQRSIRATIDYSWQKLQASERAIFAKLSVFRGGFTREAAKAVVGANLRQLSRLVSKSFLQGSGKEGDRYHIHELLRQFGEEQLGRDDNVARRHLHYFLQLGVEAGPELYGPRQVEKRTQLESELDNIAHALDWAQGADIEAGLQLSSSLGGFWDLSGCLFQEEARLDKMLAQAELDQAEEIDLDVQAKALGIQSMLNMTLQRQKKARALAEDCLNLYRTIGDLEGVAFALNRLAATLFHFHDTELRLELLAESLSIYRTLDKPLGIVESLYYFYSYLEKREGAEGRSAVDRTLTIEIRQAIKPILAVFDAVS
ncbi:MAG: helix-turn-helix domain-containing protein, partial [Chloroflexota bacterium]